MLQKKNKDQLARIRGLLDAIESLMNVISVGGVLEEAESELYKGQAALRSYIEDYRKRTASSINFAIDEVGTITSDNPQAVREVIKLARALTANSRSQKATPQ